MSIQRILVETEGDDEGKVIASKNKLHTESHHH